MQRVLAEGSSKTSAVQAGGLQNVAGTADGTVVSGLDSMTVQNGGNSTGAQVLASGVQTVEVGGSADATIVTGVKPGSTWTARPSPRWSWQAASSTCELMCP